MSQYQNWTVIGETVRKGSHYFAMCRCVCGTEKMVETASLRNGKSASCGCLSHAKRIPQLSQQGKSNDPAYVNTYRSWLHARNRCRNPNAQAWALYGGRGIRMCERWAESFDAFVADMGLAEKGLTIERIDVNGHYEPANCKWVTKREQGRNRRTTRWIEYAGIRDNVTGWAGRLGLTPSQVTSRLRRREFGEIAEEVWRS